VEADRNRNAVRLKLPHQAASAAGIDRQREDSAGHVFHLRKRFNLPK
jgi:hypothetical protein